MSNSTSTVNKPVLSNNFANWPDGKEFAVIVDNGSNSKVVYIKDRSTLDAYLLQKAISAMCNGNTHEVEVYEWKNGPCSFSYNNTPVTFNW